MVDNEFRGENTMHASFGMWWVAFQNHFLLSILGG
jgi:hypothetical protein